MASNPICRKSRSSSVDVSGLRVTLTRTMLAADFIARWRSADLTERAAAQSHFRDRAISSGGEPPTTADPKGEWYAFEKGATNTTDGDGWADVWKRGLLVVCDLDPVPRPPFSNRGSHVNGFALPTAVLASGLTVLSAAGPLAAASRPSYGEKGMTPITRRSLLASAAALPLAGTAAVAQSPVRPTAKLPHIVYFLADDLGYADVSCYGRPDIATPNIDRIAADGVRFLQGYANSAVCSATRTALITGRYQYRLRVGLEEPMLGQVPISVCHPAIPLCHHC